MKKMITLILITTLCITKQGIAQNTERNSLTQIKGEASEPFLGKRSSANVLADSEYNRIVQKKKAVLNSSNIKVVIISAEATTHFVTNDDIDYVDISSPDLAGEISNKRLFKLKSVVPENIGKSYILTLVCNSTITVYKILVAHEKDVRNSYVVQVAPEDTYQMEEGINQEALTTNKKEYAKLALKAFDKNRRRIHNINSKKYGIHFYVKNIYVKEDLIFFNLAIMNKTNLQYNLQNIRFMVEDKQKVSSSISQVLTLEPVYVFQEINDQAKPIIRKTYDNVFVLPKFTFPNKKVLHIEMTESGISGRKSDLYVEYKQILSAESLN